MVPPYDFVREKNEIMIFFVRGEYYATPTKSSKKKGGVLKEGM